jgi:acetylornithine deacetylase/succinyl-diaminopimelate desuccinylase-like protein
MKARGVDFYKNLFKQNEQNLLDEFFTFLRFPTISADPARRKDLQTCATWLGQKLRANSFDVELWNEHDAPIVFAQNMQAGPNKPTLLIYNHYDVQPVDPFELWESNPFEPVKKGNQIVARGAQDNKGQCFYVLSALCSYIQACKHFPVNVKLIIEGEEESGSTALFKLLDAKKKQLHADYAMIVDLGMKNQNIPAITLGTRGLLSLEVDIKGTTKDLHSGMHGGLAYNPLHALVALLASLRDENGKIQVPGFYDDVIMPKEAELKKMNFHFDTAEYEKQFGAAPTGGEKNYAPLERVWLRPTIEINGIGGGYQGPGGKTVIASEAHAKLSCRIVPNQNPERIGELVKNYLQQRAPKGVTVTVSLHEGKGKPVRTKTNSPIITALESACQQVWNTKCEYILEGASIPVVAALQEKTGADIAMYGLGLNTDNIHAPNECFGWDRIEKGFCAICLTLDGLAS